MQLMRNIEEVCSMRTVLLTLGLLLLMAGTTLAGKNETGALIVHTGSYSVYGNDPCGADYDDPSTCEAADTQTDNDPETPAVIWLIAAFHESSDPAVTVIYFGLDHNLPEFYHDRWGMCGPPGSLEVPDVGWPDEPASAGNSVAFGSPIAHNRLFPFYWVQVWGFEGAYYGTGINPTGGYAGIVDDSNPPQTDVIGMFGQVRWYEPGYNDCPDQMPYGACCLPTGECISLMEANCEAGGGSFMGDDSVCDPNPCPGACCFIDGHCEMFSEIDCVLFEGGWLGQATVCNPNPCPQPSEACCFVDGTCTYVSADDCEESDGAPQGYGTNCEMISCRPLVLGACCYGETYECILSTEESCGLIPESYLWIDGEICNPNPCTPFPVAEETTWGQVKAGYR